MPENTTKKFLTYDGLGYFTGKEHTRVESQIATAKSEAIDASELTLDTLETPTEGYLETYSLKQGGVEVGKIDIPKELVVVQDGSRIVEATASNPITVGETEYTSGKFVSLKIQNQTNPVYISVQELVDVYTAQQNATQVQVVVDSATNVISATIVAGSIGTTELADGAVTADKLGAKAVTTAKIDDGAVGTTQLASGVVTSLGKADSAVQPSDIAAADAETGTDGTFMVGDTAVAIKGYSTLASKVSALEASEPNAITNEEIDELFKTPTVEAEPEA